LIRNLSLKNSPALDAVVPLEHPGDSLGINAMLLNEDAAGKVVG
jgi:hypothetical protein